MLLRRDDREGAARVGAPILLRRDICLEQMPTATVRLLLFLLWGGLYTAREPRGITPEGRGVLLFVCVGEAYTQQGRAHSRRPRPSGAARPALISRAAHAVESKAVVRDCF
jgi:hypothetical protein